MKLALKLCHEKCATKTKPPILPACLALCGLVLMATPAHAYDLAIAPPDMDYAKVCKRQDEGRLQSDSFVWGKKTPAQTGLSDKDLLARAVLYSQGSLETLPDYNKAHAIVDYLIAKKTPQKATAIAIKASLLLDGKGTGQDPERAKKLLSESVDLNPKTLAAELAGIYLREGDVAQAGLYYKRAVADGNASAALALAYLYHTKKLAATEETTSNMVLLAQNASLESLAKGECSVLMAMGRLFLNMETLPNNKDIAAKWLKAGADSNNVFAKLQYANLLQREVVASTSPDQIITLWKEAAQLGSPDAMFQFGRARLQEKGGADEGLLWLERAAQREHISAMEELVKYYGGLYGAPKNDDKYALWLEKAVAHPQVPVSVLKKMTAHLLAKPVTEARNQALFALYQKGAQKGDGDFIHNVGEAYKYGVGVPKDLIRSLRYFRLAASKGRGRSIEAMQSAYACALSDRATKEMTQIWDDRLAFYSSSYNYKKALRLLESPDVKSVGAEIEKSLKRPALNENDAQAMALLYVYYFKLGDKAKAAQWLEQMQVRDDNAPEDRFAGSYQLGKLLMEGTVLPRDADKGRAYLESAAKHDNAEAIHYLGKSALTNGNTAQAEEMFRRAASLGHEKASLQLANIERERGQTDSARARYESLASSTHSLSAMREMAKAYSPDGWLSADPQKATAWFNRIVDNYPCETDDVLWIADAYGKGRYGAPLDKAKAASWINTLLRREMLDPADMVAIASLILSNDASGPDEKTKALTLLQKGAEAGQPTANIALARFYLTGQNVKQDNAKAIAYFEAAAKAQSVDAMLELGKLYISGFGAKAAPDKALYWLKEASQHGNAQAEILLKSLEGTKAAPLQKAP